MLHATNSNLPRRTITLPHIRTSHPFKDDWEPLLRQPVPLAKHLPLHLISTRNQIAIIKEPGRQIDNGGMGAVVGDEFCDQVRVDEGGGCGG